MMNTEQILETWRCREVLRDNATLLIGEDSFTEDEINSTIADIRSMAEHLFCRYGVRMLLIDTLEDDSGYFEAENRRSAKHTEGAVRITLNLHAQTGFENQCRSIAGGMPCGPATEGS